MAFQNEVDSQRIYREVSILKGLNHQNIVKLKGIVPGDNNIDMYLIFEFLESDLFNAIKDRLLNKVHKKYIVYQLAKSLAYLHSAGVVHRDIKPSNILLNASCQVKICDFGLSRSLHSRQFKHPVLTEFIATRWYRSPEVLFGSRSYGAKSDIWSLGCLVYELYTRRTLLPGKDTVEQIVKVLEFKGLPSDSERKSFRSPNINKVLDFFQVAKQPLNLYYDYIDDQEVKELLKDLLEYDPDKRWSAQQLLESPFLREFRHFEDESTAPRRLELELNDNNQYVSEKYQVLIKEMARGDSILLEEREKKSMRINLLSTRGGHRSLHHSNNGKGAYTSTRGGKPAASGLSLHCHSNITGQQQPMTYSSSQKNSPTMSQRHQDVSSIYSKGKVKFR